VQIIECVRKGSIFLFIFIIVSTYFFPGYESQIATRSVGQSFLIDNGHILYTPMLSKNTYLINDMGGIDQSWSSNFLPGFSVYMLDDGSILRTIELPLIIGGGGIEWFSAEGDLLWHYEYYIPDFYQSHHDIEPLPNGNVLLLAIEYKSPSMMVKAGRDPLYVPTDNVEVDYIVEIKPTGPTTGEIVWEWHVWDHLIQNKDPTKQNYGEVAAHPELLNINYGSYDPDWLHCNSIDYNEAFDQIMISCRNFNEIWVIDHSTTTDEAANHSGGNYGQGGDLIYRWGNPQAYQKGNSGDQKLFGQHDAQWIPNGYPGGGNP